MKTILIFAIAILFSLSAAFGQTVISGKVYSKVDGRPISGATITAKNDPSIVVKTDGSGHFTMSLPSDVKVIEVTAPGFKKHTEGIGQKTVFVVELVSNDRGNSGKGGSDVSNDPTGSTGTQTGTDKGDAAGSGKGTTVKTSVKTTKVNKSKAVSK